MNLARTFLVAGAKSVVASLWDADDRSTATLMSRFYRQIATGKSVSEALRAAQMEMLKEFGSNMPPYYWAGFTVIGDGKRQIMFTNNRPTVERTEAVTFRQDRVESYEAVLRSRIQRDGMAAESKGAPRTDHCDRRSRAVRADNARSGAQPRHQPHRILPSVG